MKHCDVGDTGAGAGTDDDEGAGSYDGEAAGVVWVDKRPKSMVWIRYAPSRSLNIYI